MLYLYQQIKGGKEMEQYKLNIEVASVARYNGADEEIDMILKDVEKDTSLTENQKEELWEFADNYRVHD